MISLEVPLEMWVGESIGRADVVAPDDDLLEIKSFDLCGAGASMRSRIVMSAVPAETLSSFFRTEFR
jgi:hypothetical protein